MQTKDFARWIRPLEFLSHFWMSTGLYFEPLKRKSRECTGIHPVISLEHIYLSCRIHLQHVRLNTKPGNIIGSENDLFVAGFKKRQTDWEVRETQGGVFTLYYPWIASISLFVAVSSLYAQGYSRETMKEIKSDQFGPGLQKRGQSARSARNSRERIHPGKSLDRIDLYNRYNL